MTFSLWINSKRLIILKMLRRSSIRTLTHEDKIRFLWATFAEIIAFIDTIDSLDLLWSPIFSLYLFNYLWIFWTICWTLINIDLSFGYFWWLLFSLCHLSKSYSWWFDTWLRIHILCFLNLTHSCLILKITSTCLI